MQTTTSPKETTSGVPGVDWHQPKKRWRARMRVNGKLHNLGSFRLYSDAVAVRRAAEAQRDTAYVHAAIMKARALFPIADQAQPQPHQVDRMVDEVILRLLEDGYVRVPEC